MPFKRDGLVVCLSNQREMRITYVRKRMDQGEDDRIEPGIEAL